VEKALAADLGFDHEFERFKAAAQQVSGWVAVIHSSTCCWISFRQVLRVVFQECARQIRHGHVMLAAVVC